MSLVGRLVLRVHSRRTGWGARSDLVRGRSIARGGAHFHPGGEAPGLAGLDLLCHDSDAFDFELAGSFSVAARLAARTDAADGAGTVGVCRRLCDGVGKLRWYKVSVVGIMAWTRIVLAGDAILGLGSGNPSHANWVPDAGHPVCRLVGDLAVPVGGQFAGVSGSVGSSLGRLRQYVRHRLGPPSPGSLQRNRPKITLGREARFLRSDLG
ncbi:MAG: hypothetical protein JWM11_1624 [Planctomycetaceae bacterium]|nr:hypothetical protein [Planctomycetaceae bacterium]